MATKFARKIEGELTAGLFKSEARKKWKDFRVEYERKGLPQVRPGTRAIYLTVLDHFERICNPVRVGKISKRMIDAYIAQRQTERGKKKGDTVSPASINKELRHLKSILNVAHEWEDLPKVPKIKMVKEPKKLIRFVTPEHFAAIYEACDSTTFPRLKGVHFTAGDWWRALLTMAYLTGWRISEPLALRRDDLDLDAGTAITRHADNKGNRDELVPLHPVVVGHLRKLKGFSDRVFVWPHHERTLWAKFLKLQETAGINLPCPENHTHTDACHVYGFHDFRRTFATSNAPVLSADALQRLMRHKSYSTTQRYINMAQHLDGAVAGLNVLDILRSVSVGRERINKG